MNEATYIYYTTGDVNQMDMDELGQAGQMVSDMLDTWQDELDADGNNMDAFHAVQGLKARLAVITDAFNVWVDAALDLSGDEDEDYEDVEDAEYDPFIRGYELGLTTEQIINQPGGPMAVFDTDYDYG